jgi:outer membrane cobalamin receptor
MAVTLAAPGVAAQEHGAAGGEASALGHLSLEDILSRPLPVAGGQERTVRDSPGIVTVVTRDEIMDSGARDLIDVLRMVPGFAFAVDVQGVVGPGFRGNWGNEGKVLLLVDGVEFTEDLYGTLQLGHHFPVNQVERIEIVRGPGSAIYGGNAELAVISITTRQPEELRGVSGHATWSQGKKRWMQRDVSLSWGQVFPSLGGLALSVHGFTGQGNRGEGRYQDMAGVGHDLRGDNYRLDPLFLNAAATWKGWTVRFILDDYRTTIQDGWYEALPEPLAMDFVTLAADARSELTPVEGLTIRPQLSHRRVAPWRIRDVHSLDYYDKVAERSTAKLSGVWTVSEGAHLLMGAETYVLRAFMADEKWAYKQYDFGGKNETTLLNVAAFSEVTLSNVLGNIVAGLRVEQHSVYGPSAVPRFSFTKVLDPLHVKLLLSRAFRAPSVDNIAYGPGIKPEIATVAEAELGLKADDHTFLSVNLFDITQQGPIVYVVEGAEEYYVNRSRAGSRGVEAVVRMDHRYAALNLTYSLYNASDRNLLEDYAVDGHPELALAFPAHKVTAHGQVRVAPGVTLDPSATFMSERYGYTHADEDGNEVLERLRPTLLLGCFLRLRDIGVAGLDFSVGVHNLLDQPDPFIQPYNGGHPPLPGRGREVMVRVGYSRKVEN